MMRKYKTGSWAVGGRVMPGCRIAPKVIDQIQEDGKVIKVGSDQVFKPAEILSLLHANFPDGKLSEGHFCLDRLSASGKPVCFYTRNINHLGGNWGAEKKRIQIGADFPGIYEQNERQGVETVLLGVYHYYPDGQSGVTLFASFSPATYAKHRTNNSAAHIHTVDLLLAQKNGVYRRLDRSGNEVLVLDRLNLVRHVNGIRGAEELSSVSRDREILAYLGEMFETLPKRLGGIQCFKEMMSANDVSRMRQGAWEGWYCEFFLERYLRAHPTDKITWWSKKGLGNLDFDLRFSGSEWFYGDLKSDAAKKPVQGNLKESVDLLVTKMHGRLWYVVIEFTPCRDADHGYATTKWWNQQLGKVDKPLSYGSRMKFAIDINRMDVYEINEATIPYLSVFCPSPCAGRQRRPKYKIPHKMKEFLRIYEHGRSVNADLDAEKGVVGKEKSKV